MYGFKGATRLALSRLRKPKGAPPEHPAPLLPRMHLRPGIKRLEKTISVIIPTKNAGEEIRTLLRSLRAQEGVRTSEVIIVDSGSTDGTVALAQSEGATVINILPEEFTHAYARNRGADAGRGDYLLFMVQDALPLTSLWLWEMSTALESNDLAGVSCAEYPTSDSDLFYEFLIHKQGDAPGQDQDRILKWDDSCSSYLGLRSNAQLCNISALIRRSVFEQYKFRTAYAEDLDLGFRLIRDGHKLGLLRSTRVLHSHKRSALYFLKRGYVDVRFLTNVFPNFAYPEINDRGKLYAEIVALQTGCAGARSVAAKQAYPLSLLTVLELCQSTIMGGNTESEEHQDVELGALLRALVAETAAHRSRPRGDCGMVWPHASKHIGAFAEWVSSIYVEADKSLAVEISAAIEKIVALHCGTHLAYLFLTDAAKKRVDASLQRLDSMLMAGV